MIYSTLIEKIRKVYYSKEAYYDTCFYPRVKCISEYIDSGYYGPFSQQEINDILLDIDFLVDYSDSYIHGKIHHLEKVTYGFKHVSWFYELSNGYYSHPDADIDNLHDLYKVIIDLGNNDDAEKFNESGILDEIGWEYYIHYK